MPELPEAETIRAGLNPELSGRSIKSVDVLRPDILKATPQEFMEDVVGLRERELIGVDNIMWASDYPHSDSTWPNSRESVEQQMESARVSPEDAYKITFGNAAKLYGISTDLTSSVPQ